MDTLTFNMTTGEMCTFAAIRRVIVSAVTKSLNGGCTPETTRLFLFSLYPSQSLYPMMHLSVFWNVYITAD